MAVNFPTSLDDFTNPASGDKLNSPSHSQQHIDINDAVEALEAKVGVDSSADATSIDYQLNDFIDQKGVANGLATLDAGGKIPSAQLPALALTDIFSVASEAAQIALTAQEGDIAIRTDLNKSYVHNGGSAGTMDDWSELLTPTDLVLSVAGKTGAVSLDSSDVGLGNVTNEAQIAKSIGTAAGDIIYFTGSGVPARLGVGTAGQVLTVNSGATAPEWADASGGGLQDVVDDTTPQLGGQLDVNGNAIGDGTLELLKF